MDAVNPWISLYTSQGMAVCLNEVGASSSNQLQLNLTRALIRPDSSLYFLAPTDLLPRSFFGTRGATLFVGILGVENAAQAAAVLGGASGPIAVGSFRANVAMSQAANALANSIRQTVNTPFRDAVIAGHSYGGGIAPILALIGRSMGLWRTPHVISYGAPRPGDFSLAAATMDFPLLRWMNTEDPIPRFPPQPSEAPAAYAALPPFATAAYSRYTQPPGGLVLDQLSGVAAAELPRLVLPITDLRLLDWAAGLMGFGNPNHAMVTYLRRILAVPSPSFAQTVQSVNRLVLVTSREDVVPAESADAVSALRASVTLEEGSVSMSVLIPLQHRPSLVKVTNKVFRVQWESQLIVSGFTRSNARALRKSLFKTLRVLQTQKNVDVNAFSLALTTYLAAAINPSGGFVPVLSPM